MDQIIALVSLIALEAVLGIDNVIFISIVAGKLPAEQQKKARNLGLILAGVMRLGLLLLISIIMKLNDTLFTALNHNITGKDLVLIFGGLFLLYKSTKEIFHKSEGHEAENKKVAITFSQVLVQILLLDLVFSIDSIITAVGMVKELWVMYTSVIVSVFIMVFAAESISAFIQKHPSFKLLALAFLLMIGVSLVADGLGTHIPKGYIYFAMAFSLLVDILQMKKSKAV